MSSPHLSVVIPSYNEELRLPRYLDEVCQYLEGRGCAYEVLVVDDGSQDGTAAVVEKAMSRYRHLQLLRLPENRGKGAAVRAGMLQTTGKLRLFADADGATPIAELERLELAIADGADLAIGSRAIKGKTTRVRGTLHRKIMGTIFNAVVQVLAVPGLQDTQCGFKLFTDTAVRRTFSLQMLDDFGFDVEILYLARKGGLSIAEVPVNWVDIPGTKVDLVRDSLRMLRDILAVRGNDLRCLYRDREKPAFPPNLSSHGK
ncbi:glycosyl transferase [Geomonas silvestris]|uniref:dolichyl-phosphate beta-glucosyltransferase n=1 Tax=Geomonas silvestris TaxID=2740184 RepID=A0A6V8MLV7_9BACT|nr:dolichyl-phosphate beta-glucosyltransferase [Geomonas silvestris]GFO61010.1 glycosyl transferase [Geomonas silvestris]